MLITEMKATEKLQAILELLAQEKSLAEIATIAGYAKKSNIKDFLKSKGYIFDGDSICGLDQKQEEELKIQEIRQVKSLDSQMADSKQEVITVVQEGINIDKNILRED